MSGRNVRPFGPTTGTSGITVRPFGPTIGTSGRITQHLHKIVRPLGPAVGLSGRIIPTLGRVVGPFGRIVRLFGPTTRPSKKAIGTGIDRIGTSHGQVAMNHWTAQYKKNKKMIANGGSPDRKSVV